MECVAYMRVSTEKQAEEGNGLDSQKRDIENYARKNELIISDWYIDDGYTGANMERPALQRLISDCTKKRVKCVVAFKLDRLSRSMVDGIYIIERVFQPNNIDFRCVHDNVGYDDPMQQAYTQMMAVFAQLDKNTMLLRMRGGMLERVKQGYWMGGGRIPYCYSYDKEQGILIPIPERAEQARQALQLFIGGMSDLKIGKMLGIDDSTLRNVLTSIVNIGLIPYKGEVYKGLHEPIFDKEEFELAQNIRKSRSKAKAQCQTEPYLLTGLCYCGVCGCKMRYQKWTHGKHKIYCMSRNNAMKDRVRNWNANCDNAHTWADEIEEAVESEILKISVNLSEPTKEKQSQYEILAKKLDREKGKLKRLYEVYSEGNDTVIQLISEKEKDIEQLKARLEEERDIEASKPNKSLVYDKIKSLADVWESISKTEKNSILKIIISKIIIVNGTVQIVLNDF